MDPFLKLDNRNVAPTQVILGNILPYLGSWCAAAAALYILAILLLLLMGNFSHLVNYSAAFITFSGPRFFLFFRSPFSL